MKCFACDREAYLADRDLSIYKCSCDESWGFVITPFTRIWHPLGYRYKG